MSLNIDKAHFDGLRGALEEIREKGTLKKIFKEGVKFASIICVATISYFSIFKKTIINNNDLDLSKDGTIIQSNEQESIILALIITLIGITVLYFLEKRKKREF